MKCIGGGAQRTVDVEVARSYPMFNNRIVKQLRGKEIPPDAEIEIHWNGSILRDHRKVQNGDTLWVSVVRQGLPGGSSKKIVPSQSFEGDISNDASGI